MPHRYMYSNPARPRPAASKIWGGSSPSEMLSSHTYTTSSHSSLEIKQSWGFLVAGLVFSPISPYMEALTCTFVPLLSVLFLILPFLTWQNQSRAINVQVCNQFMQFICSLYQFLSKTSSFQPNSLASWFIIEQIHLVNQRSCFFLFHWQER